MQNRDTAVFNKSPAEITGKKSDSFPGQVIIHLFISRFYFIKIYLSKSTVFYFPDASGSSFRCPVNIRGNGFSCQENSGGCFKKSFRWLPMPRSFGMAI
jgi:hypothetical protein